MAKGTESANRQRAAEIPATAQVALLQMAAELADRYDSTIPAILKDHGLKATVEIE